MMQDMRCVAGMLTALSKTVDIEKRFVEIEDHGIKLRLTVVDTPGFSDMVDASQWYDCLVISGICVICRLVKFARFLRSINRH